MKNKAKKRIVAVLSLALLLGGSAFGQGTILWDEGVDGLLSNDPGIPTALGTLQSGTNSVLAATELISNGIWGDYFTFAVPNALGISHLWLSSDKPLAAWLGSPDFGVQYGFALKPASDDLLSQFGIGPVASGTYGMYILNYDIDSGGSVANYRLDFVVEAVPEPSVMGLMLVGGSIVMALQRLKSKVKNQAMKRILAVLSLVLLLGGSAFGQGTILWDEGVSGSLSEDFEQPTSLGLVSMGTNSIIGASELEVPPPFLIYHPNLFTIQVPSGYAIKAASLQVDGPSVWAWIGNTGFSSGLSYTMNATSGDLLEQWDLGSIPAGEYGIYFQNMDQQNVNTVANFRLDFVVEAVPEPSAVGLMAIAGAALIWGRRKGVSRS